MMERKRMLYKSKVEYMSGEGVYTMNHILGCSHGCLYPCYAFTSAKRYGQVDSYAEWCRPVAVENARALLERDLSAKRKEPVERVHLCFTTDPFMYQQDDLCELTLQCIELINSYGVPVTTLTKGMYPFELDPDLLIFKGHPENEYGITFTTVSEPFRKDWEPHAAPWYERIAACELMHYRGVRTWASLEPFPALSRRGTDPANKELSDDPLSGLQVVLANCVHMDRVVFGRWNYNPTMPSDVGDVREWYARAADRVRRWGETFGVETIIKKGTDDASPAREAIKKSRETALKRTPEKPERESLFERGKHGVETAARILEK